MGLLVDVTRDVVGVVLAASLSRRCSQYKLALLLGGRAVIEQTVEGLCDFVDRVIVIEGGPADATLRDVLARRGHTFGAF